MFLLMIGDIAGVVVDVGSDVVDSIDVGDRVAAMIPLLGSKWGGYAEYVAVDVNHIARIPQEVSFIDAASLPLVSLTTMLAYDNIPPPYDDKKILIHAGSGGVGSFALQYAKKVMKFGTVSTTCSKRNKEFVEVLGADNVIDYNDVDFTDVIQDYDVILDPLSYMYEEQSLKTG